MEREGGRDGERERESLQHSGSQQCKPYGIQPLVNRRLAMNVKQAHIAP